MRTTPRHSRFQRAVRLFDFRKAEVRPIQGVIDPLATGSNAAAADAIEGHCSRGDFVLTAPPLSASFTLLAAHGSISHRIISILSAAAWSFERSATIGATEICQLFCGVVSLATRRIQNLARQRCRDIGQPRYDASTPSIQRI
jgi:hypothetical protein